MWWGKRYCDFAGLLGKSEIKSLISKVQRAFLELKHPSNCFQVFMVSLRTVENDQWFFKTTLASSVQQQIAKQSGAFSEGSGASINHWTFTCASRYWDVLVVLLRCLEFSGWPAGVFRKSTSKIQSKYTPPRQKKSLMRNLDPRSHNFLWNSESPTRDLRQIFGPLK